MNIPLHTLLHKLLWEEHGHWQDDLAYKTLSGQITNAEATRTALKLSKIGDRNPMFGKVVSDETRKKLSISHKGRTYKKRKKMGPRPDHVKEKIRNTMMGQKHPLERVEANRLGQLKRYARS